jgi:V/A-type H+-transporting ATPase subunit C
MDSARLSRLFDARTADDITRVMQDSGYTSADSADCLERETAAVFELMAELMIDRGFVDALLVFNDCHNLKVIEKHLVAWWPRQQDKPEDVFEQDPVESPDSRTDFEEPELPAIAEPVLYQAIESLMVRPSLVEPETLFRAIRDRQPDLVPAWLYAAAVEAATAVLTRFDVAEIDQVLDRTAYAWAMELAAELGNDFFMDYLRLRADLANLDQLLRYRTLKAGRRVLEQSLLPTGWLDRQVLLDWYEAEPETIAGALASTRYAVLSPLALTYGTRGTATEYGKLADHLVLDHLQQARWVLRGPEVPLAYMIARQIEIKNIRIAKTLLRNNIAMTQAREMARDSYFGRR